VFLRGDVVFDARLVAALLAPGGAVALACEGLRGELHPAAARADADAAPAAWKWLAQGGAPAARIARATDLAPEYTAQLRKRAPLLLCVLTSDSAPAIERELFAASYKGVTDFVTKYVWPEPAFHVVRACARVGISPNAVTLASWALVVAATVAFARGAFGLGLCAAWLMTFLDTVDGKLARVTLQSSRLGHVLDHGLDLLHPPVWWAAWAVGLAGGLSGWATPAAWIVIGGYLAGRLLEGAFLLAWGFETHSWRPLDSRFRLITARRNPNLILLSVGTLAGRPDLAFAAVAAWTLFSIAFHVARFLHAAALRALGQRLRPWEDEAAAGAT
jgi:phosphatidylglycerophosphate synthase